MLDGFAGAVAVVTGGASGIGRAIALELHRRGAEVAIADINESRSDLSPGSSRAHRLPRR